MIDRITTRDKYVLGEFPTHIALCAANAADVPEESTKRAEGCEVILSKGYASYSCLEDLVETGDLEHLSDQHIVQSLLDAAIAGKDFLEVVGLLKMQLKLVTTKGDETVLVLQEF